MKKTYHIILLLVLLFFALTGTSIIKGYETQTSRTFDNLWNFGHLLLFLYLNYIIILFIPDLKQKSLAVRLILVVGLTTILGFAIEIFQQLFMGGEADLQDILKNYIGALAAFILFWQNQNEVVIKRLLGVVLLILLFIAVKPVVATAMDEWQSRKSFPVLSDLESQTELERYSTTGMLLELSSDYVSHGLHAMKTEFNTRKYSTLALNYFQRDWSGYTYLKFDIYNPGDSLTITCRINDRAHRDHNNAYNDRFNKKITLIPGWNNIEINLAEVRNAPAIRRMNMSDILNWAIFTIQLEQNRTVFLDYIRLE